MGREVRKVSANWQHPMDDCGIYRPLCSGNDYEYHKDQFVQEFITNGLQSAIDECGNPPDINDYMPNWTEAEKTHYMMYEDTSEGTPISPAFKTPEDLAEWLVYNNSSSFGCATASYEAWLNIAKGGYAVSAVGIPGLGLINGVDASILGKE